MTYIYRIDRHDLPLEHRFTFGTRFASTMPAAPGGVSAIISIACIKVVLPVFNSSSRLSKTVHHSVSRFAPCEHFSWLCQQGHRTTWKLGWWFRFRERRPARPHAPPSHTGIPSLFAWERGVSERVWEWTKDWTKVWFNVRTKLDFSISSNKTSRLPSPDGGIIVG